MKLENVRIVLISPKFPGNVGAAARAMKVMGLTGLHLVDPCDIRDAEARWMAHGAEEVIEGAKTHRTLKGALRGNAVVVGTTRRRRQTHRPSFHLREAAAEISTLSERNRVAILFGREDKGLLNEHLDECNFIVTIPQAASHPSLNLAQAVMVVCYELRVASGAAEGPPVRVAGRPDMERMYAHIRRTIETIGYDRRRLLPDRIMAHVTRILGRAALTPTESNMIRGVCTQIEKAMMREKGHQQ